MKRTTLLMCVATIFTFLAASSASHAGVFVSLGFGGRGYSSGGYYHHQGWQTRGYCGPSYCGPGYYHSTYCAPTVYVAPVCAPVYVDRPVVYVDRSSSIAYGFIQSGGVLKSPYSDFAINVGGHSSGEVVYDANNGRAFRVP